MELFFGNRKLEKSCNSKANCVRAYGSNIAGKIMQRLDELKALDNLEEASTLPSLGCHELKGGRKGQFAVSLNRNFRLIFMPEHDPLPRTDDGNIDRNKITKIIILKASEDYHGK